jgi:hypothetical protein
VAFGLDDESHLSARVADADVGTPASDPAGGVGSPDPSDKQAPRFRDVHLSAKKIDLEIVEHVAPFVKTFKKTIKTLNVYLNDKCNNNVFQDVSQELFVSFVDCGKNVA